MVPPPGLNGPGALTCSSQPARELRDVSTLYKIFATRAKTPRCHNQEPRVGEMRSVGCGSGALPKRASIYMYIILTTISFWVHKT